MQTTILTNQSVLPLTCSRTGTCCFGKTIFINPWELASISQEKKNSPKEFRDLYCEAGGIQLLFNGTPDQKGQAACSQYKVGVGCTVYQGRPLACRLYPLGRQIQYYKAEYIYQGDQFPCLNDCAEVLELPKMSVGEYLKGQEVNLFESAQDEYLVVMQNIANIGFELLLETGLSTSGDTKTLAAWRALGNETPKQLAKKIGQEWLDCLMLPDIAFDKENPISFIQQHNDLLLTKAQETFGNIQTLQALHEASVLSIAVALHLAKALGSDIKGISEHWIETAKSFGAQE